MDTRDPMLYDLVLNLRSMSVDDAVEITACAAKRPCFQTTPQSQKMLDDMALAARIQSALVADLPNVKVSCQEGEIFVEVRGSYLDEKELMERIDRVIRQLAGIDLKVRYAFKEQVPF